MSRVSLAASEGREEDPHTEAAVAALAAGVRTGTAADPSTRAATARIEPRQGFIDILRTSRAKTWAAVQPSDG
jgi:hypothetical protein